MKDCHHMLCTDCFPIYLSSKVTSVDCAYATCPDKNCGLFIPPETYKAVLSAADYQRYEKFLVQSYVDKSYNAKYCVGKNCDKIIANKTAQRNISVECPCGAQFCFECGEVPHPPIDCELLEKWNKRTKSSKGDIEAEMNARWLNANTKRCPKCKTAIQFDYGCKWMQCRQCKHGFCWYCLGDESIHPGRMGNHAAPCANEAEARKKGREQFMKEEQFTAEELEEASGLFKKTEYCRN